MTLRTREDVALLFSSRRAYVEGASAVRDALARLASAGARPNRDPARYRQIAEELAGEIHDCLPGVPGRDEAVEAVWLAAHRYDARDFAGAQSRLGDAIAFVEYAIRTLAAERDA